MCTDCCVGCVVSDNDPALVLQKVNTVEPVEGAPFSTSKTIELRLASEPMYDVTVYVQSGAFLSSDNALLPDDEQVVFQDTAQAAVCFDGITGLRSVAVSGSTHTNACGGAREVATGSTDQGHMLIASVKSGKVLLTSATTGEYSSVSVDVSTYGASGSHAKSLFGSGVAVAGQAAGANPASAGTFTGTFTAYEFGSGKAEDLVIAVDGIEYTVTLSTNIGSVAALAAAINARKALTKTVTRVGTAQAWNGRTKVFACDPSGIFVRPESLKDAGPGNAQNSHMNDTV